VGLFPAEIKSDGESIGSLIHPATGQNRGATPNPVKGGLGS